jgi:hypothetical protein
VTFVETVPEDEATGEVAALYRESREQNVSKALDALGAEPDSAFAGVDPRFRDSLVVGRPIAAAP